jgi:hypothetical protein
VAYNVAQKRISGIESDTLALAKLLTAALRMPDGSVAEAPAEEVETPAQEPAKARALVQAAE